MLNCHPARALQGFLAKRPVSVNDMIRGLDAGKTYPPELWDEKIGDSINYLILLEAIVSEGWKHKTMKEKLFTSFLLIGLIFTVAVTLFLNYRYAQTCRVIVAGQCVRENLGHYRTALEAALIGKGL